MMFKKIRDFYKVSAPSATRLSGEAADRRYRRLRLQAFVAATIGYSLYYVCRTSLNVMKQPIIDAGVLNATQLGVVGACLYWTYAVGKFVNGFLADYCNIKKFMATGLVISASVNFIMGMLGVWNGIAGIASSLMFVMFAVMWTLNGWSQSMGSPPAIISLSNWYPLKIRGTFYGFFSASHNFGEGLSFVFVAALVSAAGWQWGFFGASVAGALGVTIIALWLHDTPESMGLAPVEVLAGEKTQEQVDAETALKAQQSTDDAAEIRRIQKDVLRNPGVWILALSSAFMYMSRYAINEWGMFFLQKNKGFGLMEASAIIAVNTVAGIIGTVCAGWISDTLFKGDRKWPALVAGIMEAVALAIFFYGGNSLTVNVIAMVIFGIAIGVLICFVGGLMAVDLVPRKATGAALGIIGMASYAAAGLMNIISGLLIDGMAVPDPVTGELVYDFSYVSVFWLGAAIISFLLPVLNWGRKYRNVIAAVCVVFCFTACRPQAKEYTFVQYNVGVFHKYDSSSVEAVSRAVREIGADAVTLNEVDSCTVRTGLTDQMAAFAREMGGWKHHYAAAMPYDGGAYGVGVASVPGLEIVRTDMIALPQSGGHEPRAAAVVEYEDFVLCSTHLDLTTEVQMEQVAVINHYIDSLYAGCGKPVFLGGDFNCFPDSEPVALMKQTWTLLTPVTFSFPSHAPDRCIDYIFARPYGRKVTVRETSIPRTLLNADLATASDHLPVALTLTIE